MKRPCLLRLIVHPFENSSIRGLVAVSFDALKSLLRINDFGAI